MEIVLYRARRNDSAKQALDLIMNVPDAHRRTRLCENLNYRGADAAKRTPAIRRDTAPARPPLRHQPPFASCETLKEHRQVLV